MVYKKNSSIGAGSWKYWNLNKQNVSKKKSSKKARKVINEQHNSSRKRIGYRFLSKEKSNKKDTWFDAKNKRKSVR